MKLLLSIIVVVLLLFLLSACSGTDSNDNSFIPNSNNYEPETNNLEGIKEEIKKNIVWIKYEFAEKDSTGLYFENSYTGSGVVVAAGINELLIYTNRHVVDCELSEMGCFQRVKENLKVRTQDGKIHPVKEILFFGEADIDLVLLKTITPNSQDYSFAYETAQFKVGDDVIAIGYPSYAPNVVEFSVSEGKINRINEVLSQSSGFNFRVIESDAYTNFGSSGGGLFNREGRLVGINTWIGDKESIAIDITSVSEYNLIFCSPDAYFAEGKCYKRCDSDQVMDANRICYNLCEEFYCNSQVPPVDDSNCEPGYIYGSDGYCHLPCGSPIEYCPGSDSICLNNQCYSCSQGYLWEDGTCRAYE